MMHEIENIDELMAKVLSGEASAEEIQALEHWKKAAKENQKYFDSGAKVFGRYSAPEPNVDAAWKKMESRIQDKKVHALSWYQNKVFIRVAAAVILLLCIGSALILLEDKPAENRMVVSAGKETKKQVLPDGSSVVLNENSEISFLVNEDNVREVALKGEAYFDVKHSEEQPFLIKIGDVLIEDIGTSFSVKALPDSKLVEVVMESGEVHFYNAVNEGVRLKKGDKAIYNADQKSFSVLKIGLNEKAGAFRNRIFHFRDIKLSDAVNEINAAYNAKIELDEKSLEDMRLSVDFKNEELDVILNVITETMDLQLENDSGKVVLKNKTP
ncbi:MAG: FecR family protein [Flavobacteriales bacterium]